MIHISKILPAVLETIKDRNLLSSRPHHMECPTCEGKRGFTLKVARVKLANCRTYPKRLPPDTKVLCPTCKGTGSVDHV